MNCNLVCKTSGYIRRLPRRGKVGILPVLLKITCQIIILYGKSKLKSCSHLVRRRILKKTNTYAGSILHIAFFCIGITWLLFRLMTGRLLGNCLFRFMARRLFSNSLFSHTARVLCISLFLTAPALFHSRHDLLHIHFMHKWNVGKKQEQSRYEQEISHSSKVMNALYYTNDFDQRYII